MKSKSLIAIALVTGGVAFAGVSAIAHADVIQSPVSAVVAAGSLPGNGDINNTLNEAGLAVTFVSGVTDFDTYIGGNPLHTTTFGCCEWFGNSGTTSAVVTYNMGSPVTINRLALWNEESSGIGLLNLFWSLDNVTFTPLAAGLVPTDHFLADYGPDVFSFTATTAQYIRFDMSRCPQPNAAAFNSCAIGEVAFAVGPGAVPEPATLALLGIGLAGLGIGRRKRRT